MQITSSGKQDMSLTKHVTSIIAGDHVMACAFLDKTLVLALANGGILHIRTGGEHRAQPHGDAGILAAASNGKILVTGDDNGRVIVSDAEGHEQIIAEQKGSWIDAADVREDGAIAWSAGKIVFSRDARGAVKSFEASSTVRGLAFFPKGYRLAVAHYNGATLWFPNTAATPDLLEWKGSHLDVTISRDGRFVVTSMQENSLHGWRMDDKKNMRMAGYPAKTRSFSWSHDGQWLATSGADASVIWPFQTKDGPMGRGPRECGVRPVRVSCVAFHPASLVLAIGYEDGWLLLCRLTDGSELYVRGEKGGKDAITALCWDATGRRLAFGTKSGAAGVLDLPAV